MVEYKYNQPYYKLHLSGLDEDAVHVYSFEGEESISRLFQYRFELISDDPELNAADILNKKATFEITRGDDESVKINGIISHFEQRGRTPDYVSYYAVLVPKMWRTTLNYGSRIFQKMTIETIVEKVLKDGGFSGEDFEFSLNASYPELDYCVQYRETDYNFINRRLEYFGIYYYFDHRDDNDVIVFTDNIDSTSLIESEDILHNTNMDPLTSHETILELACQEKVVTGAVRLKDYNYEFPQKNLIVENQMDSAAPGIYYEYGDHFKDDAGGDLLAKVRGEEILARSKIFRGKSECRLFRTGFQYKLGGHYRTDWNVEYLITKLKSRGSQHSLFAFFPKALNHAPTFENIFESMPIDREYRPPRITPVPRIPGIMTSKVETGIGDEYAFIDDQGRYKIKTHFDLSDVSGGEASRTLRLSQPYSGPGYGIHFPNHADTEIVWSCIDGNVDRPLGLGTVPNPSQASPVIENNKFQNVIRTAAGNEIILDDKTNEAQIFIQTPDANNMLFDDKDDKIDIVTTNKNKMTFDDKNENITVQTTNGHFIIMDDKNTKITVQSKNGHRISINDSGGGENITLVDKDAKNTFVIDITNQKLIIRTDEGDIDFHAPNGTIDIKATTFNLETSGDTIIKADANITAESGGDYSLTAGGNIAEEASGDMTQKATNITSEASMDHATSGMNIKSEASIEHKISGTMVSSEGSAKNDVKGALATLEASGMTTVKGATVMIN